MAQWKILWTASQTDFFPVPIVNSFIFFYTDDTFIFEAYLYILSYKTILLEAFFIVLYIVYWIWYKYGDLKKLTFPLSHFIPDLLLAANSISLHPPRPVSLLDIVIIIIIFRPTCNLTCLDLTCLDLTCLDLP